MSGRFFSTTDPVPYHPRMTTPRNTVLVIAIAFVLAACGREAEQTKAPSTDASTPTVPSTTPSTVAETPSTTTATTPASGDRLGAMGLSFPIPEGWSQVPPANSMRLAQLEVPGEGGPCVAALSSAGGGIDMNIERWVGQFQNAEGGAVEAVRDSKTINGVPVHLVEMSGTYLGMGRGAPMTNQMMRAAIFETPAGMLFIKMTGPEQQMGEIEDGWNTLVDGMTKG